MPVYEYICDDCQNKFEKRVSFSQAEKTPLCPECGREHTHKLLSTFALGGQSLGSRRGTANVSSSPFT